MDFELTQTVPNQNELNGTVIIGTIEKIYKKPNQIDLFWTEPDCFNSALKLLVIVQFFFCLVQFSLTVLFKFLVFLPTLSSNLE